MSFLFYQLIRYTLDKKLKRFSFIKDKLKQKSPPVGRLLLYVLSHNKQRYDVLGLDPTYRQCLTLV